MKPFNLIRCRAPMCATKLAKDFSGKDVTLG